MASRKEQKERLRQERLEAEATAASEQRRRRLMTLLGAAALAALLVVVVLVVASQSGSDDDAASGGDVAGVSDVDAQLQGLEQSGTVLGDPDAKVSVVEFGDLQCPACQAFSESVTPELIDQVVRPGDASLEFRNFLIIGPESETAAKGALAASEQGRYWQFVELFYRNQGAENSGYVTESFLEDIAVAAGVEDLDRWREDLEDPRWDEVIAQTDADASTLGICSTPTIVVEGPGGTEIVDTGSLEAIQDAVSRVG
jgi:protein-disulfide isomerase